MSKTLSLLSMLALVATTACIINTDDSTDDNGDTSSNSSETNTASASTTNTSTTSTSASTSASTEGTSESTAGTEASTGVQDTGSSGTAGGGCGWGDLEGQMTVMMGYTCGGSGEDPRGMFPSECPADLMLEQGAACGNLTGVGCCDSNGDAWYCATPPEGGDPQLYHESC